MLPVPDLLPGLPDLLPGLPILASAGAYLAGVLRLRSRGDRWPWCRSLPGLTGLACLAVALLPPVAAHDEVFAVHAVQHLLLGMLAPLLLALAAPVTLALRTLPPGPRRRLLALLHSRALRRATRPGLVLALDLGGMYALYLTPLYATAQRSAPAHVAVHLHLLVAGCLLTWLLVGTDPVPHRPGVRGRLAVLLIAAAGHETLIKLVYSRGLPAAGGPRGDTAAGVQLLYHGGDLVELLLAVTLLAQWYALSGRALRAERRRQDRVPQPAQYRG